ncbi:MAG TPA: DUF4391 domain-containing protein [Spirochaetales bacterium]|nr:DUF4391 domain-containing protein [Spirochaetales bacterium]HQK35712.1 DUF4391 domain-containing protein [Spirochaetales bacterium]
MIQLPSATTVGRVMPKEAFYKRLTLSSDLKEKFVTDVKRITISNSLTAATLNLEAGAEITEILVLTIDLKKQQFDGRIVENIARQNPHKLLFLLRFEDKAQLAVYYAKLYTTAWLSYDEIMLKVKGFTLDAVWQGFLEQIALQDGLTEHKTGEDIDTKLQRQEMILKLQKEIEKLEKRTQSEVQPKKKFDLYQQLQELNKKLEDTKNA